MLQELSNLVVADNTGAKRAMCFRILKQRKEYAHLGDIIRVALSEYLSVITSFFGNSEVVNASWM